MFEDTIIFLLWAALTWAISTFIIGFLDAYYKINTVVRQELMAHIDQVVHLVKPENQNGVEYWSDRDDGEFLAQGRTFDEIVVILKERYPTHTFFFKSEERVIMLAAKTQWEPVHVDMNLD